MDAPSPQAPTLDPDSLLEDLSARETVVRGARPPRIRYTHEGMVDLIVENPWISQNQIASYFGYSPAWVSTIITSDAFQARLAERREEVVDPELRISMKERFEALVTQSLRVLQEKISKPASQVPDNLVLKAAEMGAKALGIGGNAQAPVIITSEERISKLAHRLMALQGSGPVVDVEARPLP